MARMGLALVACSVFVALALALAPATSHAQQPTTAQRDEEARTRFQSGRFAFDSGRFEEALTDFRRAYALSQRPPLLYNIGRAAEELGRTNEAIGAYERFLSDMPADADRLDAQARLDALRARSAPPPEQPQRAPTTEIPLRPAVLSDADRDTGPAPSHGARLWTWIAGGAAVAFGVTSLVFWISANEKYDGLDASCGDAGCSREEIDATGAPTQVTLTNVFLVGSVLALGGAIVLFFVEGGGDGGSRDNSSSLALRVGPGGLSLDGRF